MTGFTVKVNAGYEQGLVVYLHRLDDFLHQYSLVDTGYTRTPAREGDQAHRQLLLVHLYILQDIQRIQSDH